MGRYYRTRPTARRRASGGGAQLRPGLDFRDADALKRLRARPATSGQGLLRTCVPYRGERGCPDRRGTSTAILRLTVQTVTGSAGSLMLSLPERAPSGLRPYLTAAGSVRECALLCRSVTGCEFVAVGALADASTVTPNPRSRSSA